MRRLPLLAALLAAALATGGEEASWRPSSPVDQAPDADALFPIGIAETEDGALCACYAIRTEDDQRHAVYVRWSRDLGVTWGDRKLLGACRWLDLGTGGRPVELVRAAKGLAVAGAWLAEEEPAGGGEDGEDPAPAPLRFRVLKVAPGEVSTEAEVEIPDEPAPGMPPGWILQAGGIGDLAEAGYWGLQARWAEEGAADGVRISARPFRALPDGKGGARFEPLSAWKPVEGAASGCVSSDAKGEARAEGFDADEGGWVSERAGEPKDRRVEDFLPRYMGSDTAVLRVWRWRGRPERRLIGFRVRDQARSDLVERKGEGWRPLGGAWDQPTFPVDCASAPDRMLFAALARAGEADAWRLLEADASGAVRAEPAFDGLTDLSAAAVGLGAQGRSYALARCRGRDGAGHLVACARRVDPPSLETLRAEAAPLLADLGATDEKRAATARAAVSALGPAASAFLRDARGSVQGRARAALDELAISLAPPWMDPDHFNGKEGR